MRKLIKHIFWAGLVLVLGFQSARAFSTLGPGIGGGTGGDAWEAPVIGFGLPGDVGTPKNIGEAYRRVTPIMYYASDASFLNFFGLAGTTNIDAAFAAMNGVMCGQTNTPLFLNSPTNGILSSFNGPYVGTSIILSPTNNLDSYTPALGEFPVESQEINYTAQALALTDLKSTTLGLLAEQMGLGEPERYTWDLHDRYLPPGGKCPNDELYLVVQRNYDVINISLNQVLYSPYVNGTLYSYEIIEDCTGGNPLAQAIPVAVDPFAETYTAVASFGLNEGGFYNGLTYDDVEGLRYLLSSNNITYENPAPSGGVLLTTNTLQPQLFGPTLPLSLLLSQSLYDDPNTLQTNFPGITYISVTTNIINFVTNTVNVYFTNLPPPYTNIYLPLSNGAAVYPPGGTVPFTNWSPVQYANPPQLLTTLDLTPLLLLAQFTDPATLETIYPGLLVGAVQTNFFAVEVDTNVVGYYTNQSVSSVFSNSATGLRLPIIGVLTNDYFFTNQPGPTIIDYDTTSYMSITTLDLATFSDLSMTDSPAVLQALYPGLEIISYSAFPTILYVTNTVSYLTNYTGAPYGGPPKAVTVAVSTNAYSGTIYTYQFGNVITNHYYTNRLVATQNIWTTNLIGAVYGSPLVTVTNYSYKYYHQPSGDFFIYPTNWCGFDLLLSFNPNVNPPNTYGPTNTIIYAGYNTNGATGTNNAPGGNAYGLIQNIADVYTNFIYDVRPGICQPVVEFATNYTTNIVSTYSYDFLNVVTNHYYSNSLASLFITNIYLIPGGSADQLATNITVTNFYVNIPSGDFYIVPPTWCGYQIISLLTNYIVPTNIVFTNTSYGSGTVTNQQYTEVEYLSYTNYTYSIRPGSCEPAVEFVTNTATNIINQYSYYFGNIITNNYFTNGPVTVTTYDLAILTNGLVGMLTNVVATNILYNGIGGDFYIVPPNYCDFTILSTQLTTVVTTTNTINAAIPPGTADLGESYTQTTVSSYTNSTFLVQPATCATEAPVPALRRGIERVEFIRANYDSLVGQFFQPLTNYYTMTRITNSQPVTEYYQRVVTTPDFLIRAEDLVGGASTIPVVGSVARNLTFDQSTVQGGLAGPGTIIGPTTFTYNKAGDVYDNGSRTLYGLTTNAFLDPLGGNTQGSAFGLNDNLSVFLWASFDGSTNTPVLYPNGTSLTDLANELIIQVSPATVPDGTNGVAYTPVTFSATGGQSPYTWSAPGLSASVPGLSFNASTQVLSGTPTSSGSFSFTIQVTDEVNRTVSLNYSIIVH